MRSDLVWHAHPAEDVLAALETTEHGLSSSEAKARLARFGANALQARQRASIARVLLRQFSDFMILVLVVAAIVSALLGEVIDAAAIVTIVVLNGLLGFTQELRAERALEALADMAAPSADVHRDGARASIPAVQLVPGDIVHLEAGTIAPADLRLIEAHALRSDEAALTGESEPVDKQVELVAGDDTPLGDRKNLAYGGTLITYGRGVGVVVATGEHTEFGKIASLLDSTIDTETPLSRRLRVFGVRLSIGIVALCAILLTVGVLRGEPPLLMFMTAVSLAVAAIPEALPAVVTINLALGARKMASRKAVIRRLSAVESLGSVTYVCSDKTGTLTRNRMRVERFWVDGQAVAEPESSTTVSDLLRAMVLCNDARAGASGELVGDPTETALVDAAEQREVRASEMDRQFPRVDEVPFDSSRMRMSTVHPDGEAGFLLVAKGAVEAILARTGSIRTADGDLSPSTERVLEAAEEMATNGLRVLAVAQRSLASRPEPKDLADAETDLVLLGLVGLLDPPRDEALSAVRQCKGAGITPVMITGDHPTTATAIARRLEILEDSETAESGTDPSPEVHAYARVAPEQKLAIVRTLQDDGQIVAMTGDGVNDAPALRQADVGVAMGITGTDVAKQASDIVLLDDDFATLVTAVREGRRIYDNIRRFIRYALTTNVGEVLTVASAPLLGLPIPLMPAQILFINLLTDGLPGIALAAEPAERRVMRRAPYPPGESLLARGLGFHVAGVGILIAALTLCMQSQAIRLGVENWQTMVFVTLASAQLWHVMAIRSETDSLWRLGLFSNLPLLGAVTATAAILVACVYIPPLQTILHTRALSATELALATLSPVVVFVAAEVEKMTRTRRS